MRSAMMAVVAAALLLSSGAQATGSEIRRFAGLWEGVDPGDGSLTQRSITCDVEGACEVLGADSLFRLCSGVPGILAGSGALDGGVLVVPDFTLSCSNDASVSVDTTFTPDLLNGTLVEQTVNPEIPSITFHRISLPPRGHR